MMKWKTISKRLAIVLTAAMCMFGASVSAFAQSDENASDNTTETTFFEPETESSDDSGESSDNNVIEEVETDTADSEEDSTTIDRSGFTVPGNASLEDDIVDSGSTKEFLTIKTKNNQTFYVIIDRSNTGENVYMLSTIDEMDLQEFLADADASDKRTGTSILIGPEEEAEDETTVVDETKSEEDETKVVTESDGKGKGYLGIAILAVIGLAVAYYFKIYKKKNDDFEEEDEGLETNEEPEVEEEEEEHLE